jgi:hypothetical protein
LKIKAFAIGFAAPKEDPAVRYLCPNDFRHVRWAPIAAMMTDMSTHYAAVTDLQRRLLVLDELAAYAALLRREALAREATRFERESVRVPEPAGE